MHVKGTDACGHSCVNDYMYGTTFSFGLSSGQTQGNLSYNNSYVISTDSDTIAFQETNSAGIATGIGVSAGFVVTITNANNIFDLERYSKAVGGTIVFQSKGISIEYIEFNPKSNSSALCKGFSFIIPIGAEVEFHLYENNTQTHKHWITPTKKVLEALFRFAKG